MRHALGWMTAALAASVMMMATPVMAQPMAGPPGPGAAMRQGPRMSPAQRAERRARMLKNRVGLNDATTKRVVAILAKYDQRRRQIAQSLRTHRRKLVELVRSDSNDQAAYRAEIRALKQAKRQMQQLRDQEFAELQRVLTPKQQAKMLVEMVKFRRHHGKRGRGGKGRRAGRRGHGPWGGGAARP